MPVLFAAKAALYAVIVALLVRHVRRHGLALAATAGPRFPGLYWAFAATMGLDAAWLVALDAGLSALATLLAVACIASAAATAVLLPRSQAESATLWRTAEGIEAMEELRAASRAVIREYRSGGDRGE